MGLRAVARMSARRANVKSTTTRHGDLTSPRSFPLEADVSTPEPDGGHVASIGRYAAELAPRLGSGWHPVPVPGPARPSCVTPTGARS